MLRSALFLLLPAMVFGCSHAGRRGARPCEPARIIDEARASLQTRAWSFERTRDADGNAFAPRWPAGFTRGEAVVSWPDPGRFDGAPDEFLQLARRSFVYDGALLALERIRRGDR